MLLLIVALSTSCSGTNSGRKRYNIPADIEMSLENLSQQTCSVVAVNQSEIKASFPDLYRSTKAFKEKQQVGMLAISDMAN